MCDDNMREYLLPQVQMPFVNPSLKDAYVEFNQIVSIDQMPKAILALNNEAYNNLQWQSLYA